MTDPRPEKLLDELNRLESLRDPAKTDHKRQFQRFVIRGEAELHPTSRSRLDRTPVEVKLRDLGRGGVGFVCPEALAQGSDWRICFLQRGYVVGHQDLVVRYCVEVDRSVYLIGAQFVINNGLMTVLGVDPSGLHEHGRPEQNVARLVPPSDAA